MFFIVLAFGSEQERDKFEYLYSKYKNLLLKKAYDILQDYMLAEDAVSEAYLRIYKNLSKIDDVDSGRSIAFLVTIAKNAALTLLEKKNKNATAEIPEEQADGFELEGQVVAALGTEEIYRLINSVGEEYKNVFLLKYAYDYSNQEIGKLLKINANHVGVLLHRAKKKLAAILREEGYIDAKA